jgi:hypothetical protein
MIRSIEMRPLLLGKNNSYHFLVVWKNYGQRHHEEAHPAEIVSGQIVDSEWSSYWGSRGMWEGAQATETELSI